MPRVGLSACSRAASPHCYRLGYLADLEREILPQGLLHLQFQLSRVGLKVRVGSLKAIVSRLIVGEGVVAVTGGEGGACRTGSCMVRVTVTFGIAAPLVSPTCPEI